MVQMNDIHPLTAFLRDHKSHIERLSETGRPEVLTVNGRARVVVQDAEAYQRMLDVIDSVQAERILKERIASIDRGDPGVPAAEALADVRKALGIKSSRKR